MAIVINESDKYYIRGKIIDINGDLFTISVISPFTHEIKFYCTSGDYNVLHPPVSSKYNWLNLQNSHPSTSETSAYYNTGDKCFYKKESGTESEWKSTDFEDLYNDNPSLVTKNPHIIQEQEKYRLFRNRYIPILQKEQLCNFSAYVLRRTNEDWCSIHSQQVERHPNDYDYFWIYDPDSFTAEKWNAESIDDLVKEIRPSRDCLKQLLESYEWDTESIDDLVKKIRPSRETVEYLFRCYKKDDRDANIEKWKRIGQGVKSIPKRVEDFLRRYRRLVWSIITFGTFLVGIGSLIVAYLTYSKG